MTRYYDTVNNILREYYQRSADQDLSSQAVRECTICAETINARSAVERRILRELYTADQDGSFADAVRKCAVGFNRQEWKVWKLIRTVTKEIALRLDIVG